MVESLQAQLRESEPLVADLQEKADSMEETRVLLERKVARAERERDLAERDCAEIEVLPRRSSMSVQSFQSFHVLSFFLSLFIFRLYGYSCISLLCYMS